MNKIYKHGDTYCKMLAPVGHCKLKGYEHYALWIKVKKRKFLWRTFFTKYGQQFFLDMYGFKELKN